MRKWPFIFLLVPGISFGAHAVVTEIENVGAYTNPPFPTFVNWTFRVNYQGPDVPGIVLATDINVVVTTNTTPSQLVANLVTGVTNYAVTQGFTVPVGGTFVPTYIAQ